MTAAANNGALTEVLIGLCLWLLTRAIFHARVAAGQGRGLPRL
jgi:hypothetical protein